jgi:hypothetical protein
MRGSEGDGVTQALADPAVNAPAATTNPTSAADRNPNLDLMAVPRLLRAIENH